MLALVAEGLTDAQVAETLVVSIRTVHAHLRSIYRKLDVRTRAALRRATRVPAHAGKGATTGEAPERRGTVVLVGTLDTKGHEYAFLRDRIRARAASTSCWSTRASLTSR